MGGWGGVGWVGGGGERFVDVAHVNSLQLSNLRPVVFEVRCMLVGGLQMGV